MSFYHNNTGFEQLHIQEMKTVNVRKKLGISLTGQVIEMR